MAASDREQLILELVNDARLDPLGNASRYISSYKTLASPDPAIAGALDFFRVDGAALLKQYSKLKPVAPLAWNDKLAGAARNHNAAMIEANAQKHQLPGEKSLGTRIEAKGYDFKSLGENIYPYGSNALETHAAFMVDWGGSASDGGIQKGAGHRVNIMSAGFREVGIGVTLEPKHGQGSVGPQVVTQDFGSRFDGPAALLLGVAFKDKNKDGFYGLGEGMKGLKVSLDGKSVSTAAGGGYTLGGNAGEKVVSLSGGGLKGGVKVTLDLAQGDNVKLDVVNGSTLRTSAPTAVSGPVAVIDGLGIKGLELTAAGGRQTLIGTAGKDTLAGGSGADTFEFDAALSKTNVDAITDFSVKQNDQIALDQHIFAKLAKGTLAEGAFFTGTKAHDRSDRVIYDDRNGKLFYDTDGKGGKAAVQFATLDQHLKIDHLDFLVV